MKKFARHFVQWGSLVLAATAPFVNVIPGWVAIALGALGGLVTQVPKVINEKVTNEPPAIK